MAYKLITEYDSGNYTPQGSVPALYGMSRTIDFFTIHWWGDPAYKPSFMGVVDFLCRLNGNTSAHEVITAGQVAVIIDHIHAAWHAGNATGNAKTLGLELDPRARPEDYATAAERIKDLWAFYGYKPLKPHKAWYNTACPGVYDLAKLERMAKGTFGVATPAKPKPITKPKPKPKAKVTKSLHLPKSATSWAVYPLNRPPVAKNAIGYLNPSQFNGLTYDIIRMAQADVAVIDTRDWGEVQIYVNPAKTGAKITDKTKPTPRVRQYVQLPKSAAKWGIYRQGVAPVVPNIFHYLTPAKFNGLEYEVKGWVIKGKVALIDTGVKGRVQIYVGADSGAKIVTK